MAILKNLIVNGSSRFLNKAYFQDVQISGTASFESISASGDITAGGNLKSTTGNLYLKNLLAINGQSDSWLRINANKAFSSGVYFGSSLVRVDGNFEIGGSGSNLNIIYNSDPTKGSFTVGTPATFNGTTTTISNLAASTATINNATVTGDLTVGGVLQANDFIKNIVKAVGGQLYVSPTFQALSSTTVTCTAVTATQLSLTLSDNAINGTDYAGATWYKDSKIMLSGTLTANTTGHTEEIIFSSVPGIVAANMSNSNKLQIKLDYNGASTYFKTGTLTTSDVAVMMYQICIPSGSTNAGLHPIGIYIKAYGTDNKNSYIDIFGGTSNTPNARLGLLTGLSAMQNGTTPSGWGIATTNGFFDGTIVSSSGKIGAFTLSSDLRSGTWGASGSVLVAGGYTPTTADAKSIGGSPTTGNTWAFTAGNTFGVTTAGKIYASDAKISGDITATSGTIGGVTANNSYGLYTNSKTSAKSTNTGFLISKDGAIYLGAYNSTNQACPFQVTNAGFLTATSGKIGGWNIGVSSLYSGTHLAYNSNVDGIFMDSTYIAGGKQAVWYLKNDGSAKIGAMTLSSDGTLAVPAANITGSFSVGKIDGLSDSLSNIENTANAALGQSVWYATCETAAATAAKIATITPATTEFTLKAGATVNVTFQYTNSNTTTITLNVNETGAKNIKYINNNSITNIPGVGYILANRTYQFVYDGTYWVIQNLNTYTDTINRTKYDIAIRANGSITAFHIICGTSNGYKDIGGGVSFDLSYPLLYAATGLSTGGTGSNNFLQINDINASNNGTIIGGAAYKTLYLKGKVSSNTFTISSSEYLTATPPSNIDNLYYIPLGTFRSGSTNNIYFNSSSRLYAYINGAFQPVDMAVRRYITDISSGGIKVSYATDPINYLQIVPSGINIFKNNNQIASYGSSIILGELADGKTHVEIDSDSFDVCLGATTGANSTKLATFGETVVLGANNDAQLSINESEIIMTNNYFNANDYFGSADIFTVKTTIPDVRTYEAAGFAFEYYPPDEVFDTQKATIEIQGNYIKGVGEDVYLVLLDKTNNWAEYSRVKLSTNYYTSGYDTSKAYVIINNDGINFINNTMSQTVAQHAYIDFAHIAFNVTLQDTPLTTMNIIGDLNVSGRFDENTVTTIGGRITCEEIANGDGTTLGAISHIGSIIMSTTLQTMDQVIAIYGGEYWIQHSGYFLYGATSGVTADFNTKDGGYDSVKLTAAQSGVGSHGHSVNMKRTNITVNNSGNTMLLCHSSNGGTAVTEANASGYVGHKSAAASSAHENMPPYKNVYIWERTA